MSKDDTCKVSSASKHKERKPKKPHYIPRPWGKPYNYKCFQCPFTCMEKSHLYNHMKYSLCKNSLSLLIESDWPYKKGNILHPDQLRSFQHGLHNTTKDELELTKREDRRPKQRSNQEDEVEDKEAQDPDEEEEEVRSDGGEVAGVTKESINKGETTESRKTKQSESDMLMADMLSLEDQLLRARSVEVEAQLKHYKLSKTCLSAPGLLSEQWRLLASSHTKAKAEPRDPTGLNLSVLGVGYPISPSLFSYMNSAMPTAATSLTAQNQLAQQLPFLASAAQLIHPASNTHTPAERALIPPRLYYPFLYEHTFGQSEPSKTLKTSANNLEGNVLSNFQPKVNLWKVPAVRPATSAVQSTSWGSSQRDSPEQSFRVQGDKQQITAKEGKAMWGLKRTGVHLGNMEAPAEKKPNVGFTLDFLKNIQTASGLNMVADQLLSEKSLQDAPLEAQPLDSWYKEALNSPKSEPYSTAGGPNIQDSSHSASERSPESVAALLTDLSKALQDYQEAEHKISHMETEDLPAQRHLWEHLSKIRSELSHIHQALERTSRPTDGPLDLSVKRSRQIWTEEDEDEDRDGKRDEAEDERERKALSASLESRKQSLDMLIKMSQTSAAVVSGDVLTAGTLALRPSPNEALWPSRTTKCEADSSVLLCPDGRSVVFTEITAKAQKRPPSIQRFETQCPPSPLAVTDN
ncbi:hypothetical protein WMY93_011009 [Mugilogobius chulae]|uniref:Zinc finger protein 750-like zinc finger domain-containing protein n=1 Tax=Mugilogobius chulae TaxID=88201 RepID=A0AAW0P8W4_9GOBI